MARRDALVLLIGLGVAGCGHAGHPAIGGQPPRSTRVQSPATLQAACQEHTSLAATLQVRRTGTRVTRKVRKGSIVRQLRANVCHLPKTRPVAGATGPGYHLRLYNAAGVQLLSATAYRGGRLVYRGRHTDLSYRTNHRFWSLLAKALGVPEQKLFTTAANP